MKFIFSVVDKLISLIMGMFMFAWAFLFFVFWSLITISLLYHPYKYILSLFK
jgi:hypothetical protein